MVRSLTALISFVFHPHTDPDASDAEILAMADKIAAKGLNVGSLVAPVWPGTVGASAMGSDEDRKKFVLAVEKACRIANLLKKHGVRKYGVIRIDSATGPGEWVKDPIGGTKKIAATLRKPLRSRKTTASGWPRKGKSAGPACTRGRP